MAKSKKRRFSNTQADNFLARIPRSGIIDSDLGSRCKFNFSFFDSRQPDGSSFESLDSDFLLKLVKKIQGFSAKPLTYWRNERIGRNNVLEIYGAFPNKSNFEHPVHVPHDVLWARFRLGSLVRLVGFVLPADLNATMSAYGYPYDSNTFYVVFIDLNHKFYLTERD